MPGARYVCIHAHFYQPPRENPWLEAVEHQDGAYPYHDWNERITAECYAPNAFSRILDDRGRIAEITNNFARISFNVGPTLLTWLEEKAPDTYRAVLEADRESRERFSGHGSAIAQVYNHIILPLANERDKRTQVRWGIADFERRFERKPEGMWLAETAVDTPTLEILAEAGIRFTILAPHQARRFRRKGESAWKKVPAGGIDTTTAYEAVLPSGRRIALFFYDGPSARAVAFEGLLDRGENLAERLLGTFAKESDRPRLAHIATDGESYGHHHRFGDMALAYALRLIETGDRAELTNYGEFLERHPPAYEVEIVENSSWSCSHGIERWKSDCGCHSGAHPGWNQSWRGPLRTALDGLRDALIPLTEEKGKSLFKDPWTVRDAYIDVILDRPAETAREKKAVFLGTHAARELWNEEQVTALKLLELQRNALLMYTSCGWFFDELSGIETVQILQYAGRTLQLAQEIFGDDLEENFLKRLEKAKSNLPEQGDGRRIFERFVRPARVDLAKVAAHYAVSSLFEKYTDPQGVYCYSLSREEYREFASGASRLLVGRTRVASDSTTEAAAFSFGVLHLGDHNLSGGVRTYQGEDAYRLLQEELTAAFHRSDFPELIRMLDANFQASTYSLRSLFRDEQDKILDIILDSRLKEAEAFYRQLYERHGPLLGFLKDLGHSPPRSLEAAAEFALGSLIREALEGEEPDAARIRSLLEEARMENVALDVATLEFRFRKNLEKIAERLRENPHDAGALEKLREAAALAHDLPFEVNLWSVQNHFHFAFKEAYPRLNEALKSNDAEARRRMESFRAVGESLFVRLDDNS